jgi:hypothetical protein
MISSIIHTFENTIENQALAYDGVSSKKVDVQYVKLENGQGDSLYPDAINIALFGSNPERDLTGTYRYTTPTKGNEAMNEKPPLRVSVDVLLLFNFSDYLTALRSYDLVFAYFYNNDLLKVSSGDQTHSIQVLMSQFNDLNEIEIWSSFNSPGIPMLRYELKFAIIPGKFEELPMIKEISTSEGILHKSVIPPMVSDLFYTPIYTVLNTTVIQKTSAFCSIPVPKTQKEIDQLSKEEKRKLQETIDLRYATLLNSYSIAQQEIALYKTDLERRMNEGILNKEEYEPYIPSITGLEIKTEEYSIELSPLSPTIETYYETCEETKEKVEGITGLPADYTKRLSLTSAYVNTTDALDQDILDFNAVGGQGYIPRGQEPYGSFKQVDDLSTMQWRKYWWEIENKMTLLINDYESTKSNDLFNQQGASFEVFTDLIDICLDQLVVPYEQFKSLNIRFNRENPKESQEEIQAKFHKAYSMCYPAVNYINTKNISVVLAQALQNILVEINT